MNDQKWCVYLLKDLSLDIFAEEGQGSRLYYVGMTNDVAARFIEHRNGRVKSTRHGSWMLVGFLTLKGQKQAAILERWLKVGDSRQKREEFHAMILNSQTDEENVAAFYARAQRWNSRRERKGRVA